MTKHSAFRCFLFTKKEVTQMRSSNPYQPMPYVKIEHPEWSKNATIYQINTRQFTEEGTFRAAEHHLLRLKELGVVIVWLIALRPLGAVPDQPRPEPDHEHARQRREQ